MDGSETDELATLLARCGRGDHAALRRIYELQAPRLKGVALRITGDEALAEDALHDVFVRLGRQAARFDPSRAPASAWLVLLVRFRAMELVRRGRREPVAHSALPDTADDAPDPLALAAQSADGRRLASCLDELAPHTRHAITLAFTHGLTHAAIAGMTGTPLGTVKSLIRRGLLALRRCMDR